MKKIFFVIICFLTSCTTQTITEEDAWNDLLISHDILKSNEKFNQLIIKDHSNKKHYLGLAYSECILEQGDCQQI